ncbi:MAG: calcium/sodium antiporter [Neomegalonema sp.]|nr:calcium/sodium antiporter [Neomegalonema sp.]
MSGLFIVGGLALLALGGEFVVNGGVRAARALRVPTVIIGVVLLGFGTSLPELVTSLRSVGAGEPDLAIGNIVGSNIANLLLIAGFAAALAGAATTQRLIWRDGMVMLAATAAFAWALFEGGLTELTGAAYVGALALFMIIAMIGWTAGGSGDEEAIAEAAGEDDAGGLLVALLLFIVGVALTVGGAWLLVDGAVDLAEKAGLSRAVIGATIVAVGTSLPELAATVAAAMKGRSAMALGNVFGSNIFNILGIAGAAALYQPAIDPGAKLATPPEILQLDLWVMLGATLLTLFMARSWARLSRWEGLLLLLLYAIYLGLSAQHAAVQSG